MKALCKIKQVQKIILPLMLLIWMIPQIKAQEILTLERAIEFAETGSPDLQRSLLNRERYQKSLEAQRAALKSRLSLDVSPVGFSRNRRFDPRVSEWYTNENFETSALFRVVQPILPTDGTLSLTNEFGWQRSFSSAAVNDPESRVFYNNLYLNFNQPLFTYNRLDLELRELELNFENANIAYAIQRLNLERNVTEYFYNVYLARMNLSIAMDELENTQKSFEIISNKVEAGLAARE
jgi:outer membrane protein TolC